MTKLTYYKCEWCKIEGKNLENWIYIPEIKLPYIEKPDIDFNLEPETMKDLSFCSYDHLVSAVTWYKNNRGGEKRLPK